MQKPRYGGRGLVVYVDNQLRYSKRFDAAGIERDHPELFVPFPRRRSSSSHSLSGMVNGNGQGSDSNGNQEGQLRYWTSDMCNKSPQLFDFVVTVSLFICALIFLLLIEHIAWWRWNCSFHLLVVPTDRSTCVTICFRITWFPYKL